MSQCRRGDMVLLGHIREQHRLSLHSYGRPRMTEELQELGLSVGHRRVGRLMGKNGIKIIRTIRSTLPSICWIRIFLLMRRSQKWAGNISYVWINEGWLYLAAILDLHSRRVIGWAVSNRMKRDLAQPLGNTPSGRSRDLAVYQWVLQSAPTPLVARQKKPLGT